MSYETFTWWPKELSCRLNKWLLLGDYAIWTVIVSEKSEMNTRIHSKTQDRFFWSNSCFTVTSLSSKISFSSVHTCTEEQCYQISHGPLIHKNNEKSKTRTTQEQNSANAYTWIHCGMYILVTTTKKSIFCSLKF